MLVRIAGSRELRRHRRDDPARERDGDRAAKPVHQLFLRRVGPHHAAILLGGENRIGFGKRAEEVETTIIDFYV